MHPPSRARRILKWTGVGLSLLILVTWTMSLWFKTEIYMSRNVYVVVSQNFLFTFFYDRDVTPRDEQFHFTTHVGKPIRLRMPLLKYDYPDSTSPGRRYSLLVLPFWLLLLLTAIPTAWLWHRDRRLISSSLDHRLCLRCGYDLTGNTSGVCPECGDKACPPAGLADSECAQAKPPPAPV